MINVIYLYLLTLDDDDDCITGDVRLEDGNATAGRVELCLGGVWGTICRNNWDEIDATVVCSQLGLGKGSTLNKRMDE